MRRATSDPSMAPKLVLLRRTHSSKRAAKYFELAEPPAEEPVLGVVVGIDETGAIEPSPPEGRLKVGQAVLVKKAGVWINEYASVKAARPDGTYDVNVYSEFSTGGGRVVTESGSHFAMSVDKRRRGLSTSRPRPRRAPTEYPLCSRGGAASRRNIRPRPDGISSSRPRPRRDSSPRRRRYGRRRQRPRQPPRMV